MTTTVTRAWPTKIENVNGLTEDEIYQRCPAVFAEQAHESRSSRFVTYPTGTVLTELRKLNFIPTLAMQGGSRIEGKHLYTRHLVRVRQIDDLGFVLPDTPEIVVINAADGTAAYKIILGVFRYICANGQISGDEWASIRVPHSNNVVEEVLDATLQLSQQSEEIMYTVNALKNVRLDWDMQKYLAQCAMLVRYGAEVEAQENEEEGQRGRVVESTLATLDEVPQAMTVFQPEDFLMRRREEDGREYQSVDAWRAMNVVQENLLREGVSREVPYIDERGRPRKRLHKTKNINSVAANVSINQACWALTKLLAKHEGADL
jgi:hypothetical protein